MLELRACILHGPCFRLTILLMSAKWLLLRQVTTLRLKERDETMTAEMKHESVRFLMNHYFYWSIMLDNPNVVEQAEEILNGIGRYNDFDPEEVVKILKAVEEKVNDFDSPVSHTPFRVTIGRENSPVIYIECHKSLCDMLCDSFKAAKADEIYQEKTNDRNKIKIRAFWD